MARSDYLFQEGELRDALEHHAYDMDKEIADAPEDHLMHVDEDEWVGKGTRIRGRSVRDPGPIRPRSVANLGRRTAFTRKLCRTLCRRLRCPNVPAKNG